MDPGPRQVGASWFMQPHPGLMEPQPRSLLKGRPRIPRASSHLPSEHALRVVLPDRNCAASGDHPPQRKYSCSTAMNLRFFSRVSASTKVIGIGDMACMLSWGGEEGRDHHSQTLGETTGHGPGTEEECQGDCDVQGHWHCRPEACPGPAVGCPCSSNKGPTCHSDGHSEPCTETRTGRQLLMGACP